MRVCEFRCPTMDAKVWRKRKGSKGGVGNPRGCNFEILKNAKYVYQLCRRKNVQDPKSVPSLCNIIMLRHSFGVAAEDEQQMRSEYHG